MGLPPVLLVLSEVWRSWSGLVAEYLLLEEILLLVPSKLSSPTLLRCLWTDMELILDCVDKEPSQIGLLVVAGCFFVWFGFWSGSTCYCGVSLSHPSLSLLFSFSLPISFSLCLSLSFSFSPASSVKKESACFLQLFAVPSFPRSSQLIPSLLLMVLGSPAVWGASANLREEWLHLGGFCC